MWNADSVHVVSSSSGSGQSQPATKYISCLFEDFPRLYKFMHAIG